MNRVARFAYAQARLQARHAARPDAATWRRLAGVGDRLHYLQHARTTGLRPWVLHFGSHTGVHELELSLRDHLRQYIDEVAGWQPPPWRDAVSWTRALLDLPALQHLLLGDPPTAWMAKDPVLRRFAVGDTRHRLRALEDSEYAPLLAAWRAGESLVDGWLECWRETWPRAPGALLRPLDRLVEELGRRVLAPVCAEGAGHGERARERLLEWLTYAFRRHTHQPAAAFVHLALVALDVQCLRADLLRRTLFDDRQGVQR